MTALPTGATVWVAMVLDLGETTVTVHTSRFAALCRLVASIPLPEWRQFIAAAAIEAPDDPRDYVDPAEALAVWAGPTEERDGADEWGNDMYLMRTFATTVEDVPAEEGRRG